MSSNGHLEWKTELISSAQALKVSLDEDFEPNDGHPPGSHGSFRDEERGQAPSMQEANLVGWLS